MKKKITLILLFLVVQHLFSETYLDSLLLAYLKNDLTLQKYALNAKLKALSYDATKISNGIEVQLSSGTVKIQSSSDGTKYTFTPSASLSIPQASNTSITASVPISKKSGYEDDLENGTYIDNGNIKVSTGIISKAPLKRKISLLEAERAYLEAERTAKNYALSVENEFYTKLKTLYSYVQKVLSSNDDVYDDELSLKILELQGYSKTSASYRKKYLELASEKRTVEENFRKLERETALFASKCDVQYEHSTEPLSFELKALDSVLAFLPKEIPAVEIEDISSYKSSSYSKTENAAWSKYIGELKRSSDYSLELDAYGGYTFNDSSAKYDTVDAGLSFDWKGLSASAGVSVPTGQNILPVEGSSSGNNSKSLVYTFSFAIKPNTWKLAQVDKNQDELNSKIDDISIKSAEDDYKNAVLDKITEKSDLLWSEKSYAEEYDMYSKLESDMKNWLNQGSVTQSDYYDAENNKKKSQLNILINAIDKIIYNNNVKMLFIEDKKQNGE